MNNETKDTITQSQPKGGMKKKKIIIGLLVLIAIIAAAVFLFLGVLSKIFKPFTQAFDITNNIGDIITEQVNGQNSIKNQAKVSLFNDPFESKDGTNNGYVVKELLQDIATSNKKNPDRLIKVVYKTTSTTQPAEITKLKHTFDDNSKYEVYLEYDADGYIYLADISDIDSKPVEEQTDNEGDNADIFNIKYESKNGTNYGIILKYLLEDIVTNNKKNSKHLISVTYKSTTTTDPDEITKLKHTFNDTTKYEISFDYDTTRIHIFCIAI